MSSDLDPAQYRVELRCGADKISETKIGCQPDESLNVNLFGQVAGVPIQTFSLTKEQLHCMNGDVIDVFFKYENIEIITNITDPLDALAAPNQTITTEEKWGSSSCMEPWKHTLYEYGLYRPSFIR